MTHVLFPSARFLSVGKDAILRRASRRSREWDFDVERQRNGRRPQRDLERDYAVLYEDHHHGTSTDSLEPHTDRQTSR